MQVCVGVAVLSHVRDRPASVHRRWRASGGPALPHGHRTRSHSACWQAGRKAGRLAGLPSRCLGCPSVTECVWELCVLIECGSLSLLSTPGCVGSRDVGQLAERCAYGALDALHPDHPTGSLLLHTPLHSPPAALQVRSPNTLHPERSAVQG